MVEYTLHWNRKQFQQWHDATYNTKAIAYAITTPKVVEMLTEFHILGYPTELELQGVNRLRFNGELQPYPPRSK